MCFSCCQNSSCTLKTVQAYSYIAFGIGIASVIPLVIGCFGKYAYIPMDSALSQGMIVSGSLGLTMLVLGSIGIIAARRFIPSFDELLKREKAPAEDLV